MKNKRLIIISILLVLLIILTILVKLGVTDKFDEYIFDLVLALRNPLNNKIFKLITFLGSTLFIVVITIIFFFLWKKNRGGQLMALVIIISTLVNNLFKIIIRRARPIGIALVEESTFSYPSGHTMAVVTLVSFLLIAINRGEGSKKIKTIFNIVLPLIAFLILLSRIYLGVHFITDVISGVITSLIIVLTTTFFIDKKTTTPPTLF
ncbi:MAG: phosphatase PAP2 family protein [Firmicutes bacterium]|nr:phosphatase PAP2 family protein [Bacillota bacterium]